MPPSPSPTAVAVVLAELVSSGGVVDSSAPVAGTATTTAATAPHVNSRRMRNRAVRVSALHSI